MSTPEILIPARRLYGRDVHFDYDETVRIVERMLEAMKRRRRQRDELFKENQRLRERLDSDRTVSGNYMTDEHGQRWVKVEHFNAELDKQQVDIETLRARVDRLEHRLAHGPAQHAEVKLTPAGFRVDA